MGNRWDNPVVGAGVHSPRPLALVLAALLAVALAPAVAGAHPSDLDTLTLDLILDHNGLVLIDGAANHATYQEAPPEEQRASVAVAVLDALGIPRETADVDATKSLIYHEVGFTVLLRTAFANTAVPGELRIDSRALQEIAANSVGMLKLDVCRVAWPDQALEIDADLPASRPDPSGAGAASSDRLDCESWKLQADDEPVTLIARTRTVAAPQIPPTTLRLECAQPTDLERGWVPSLGAIALPTEMLHARATSATDRSARLVAETVVFVKASTKVELVVPRSWRGRMSLGVRNGVRATERLEIPSCPGVQGRYAWLVYLGSFWVEKPACVPIIVKTAKSSRRVHIGIGMPCRSGTRGR